MPSCLEHNVNYSRNCRAGLCDCVPSLNKHKRLNYLQSHADKSARGGHIDCWIYSE